MSEHLPLLNPPASSFIMPPHETQAKEEANVRSGLSTTASVIVWAKSANQAGVIQKLMNLFNRMCRMTTRGNQPVAETMTEASTTMQIAHFQEPHGNTQEHSGTLRNTQGYVGTRGNTRKYIYISST